jgi:hypothetical protein
LDRSLSGKPETKQGKNFVINRNDLDELFDGTWIYSPGEPSSPANISRNAWDQQLTAMVNAN